MTRYMRRRIYEFRACGHAKSKITLAVVSAICSGLVLRWLAGTAAMLLPYGSWAADIAHQVAYLPAPSFWAAAGVAALGGAASLFHELRTDMTRFSFLNAFGHMTSAQFAGLMLYLVAVNWEWSWPLTLLASGVAGWGGNKTISALNDALVRRVVGQIDQAGRP